MAALLLAAAGSAIGGMLGGVGAVVGQAIGGIAGALIDQALLRNNQSVTGPRLSDLDVQSSTEGNPIPRVYGRVRIAGQVIWATRHEEATIVQETGGKGGTSSTTYKYYANFAVALCEGPIRRISRIWADGTLLETDGLTMRVALGGEGDAPDPLILARQGGPVPAYRGTAHVVFERMPLDDWGNRIPQLTFEVIRVVDTLEPRVRAVTMIPGSTEFGYTTTRVSRILSLGSEVSENRHVTSAATDFVAALDELCELCPRLRRIALVVTWFGDDLRAGVCRLAPGVDAPAKSTSPLTWTVAGFSRGTAHLVSTVAGRAAYGGTPSDDTILAAIAAIRGRGLEVMLYPFVAMDIAVGNGRPDPWGGGEQPAYPWRGRITCDPAPGRPGSADRTALARTQVDAFVGTARPWHFWVGDGRVAYSGPAEATLRRMILHYAHLAALAGGVEAFLVGSEFVGLSTLRDGNGAYPFVEALVGLAADVRAVLGGGTRISYGADWSEWFGHHPADGSGDVRFHLDPLWASPAIDFVGIDTYFPLADWRPGDHLDATLADLPTDFAYLRDRVASGEGFDWYYASEADRRAQHRTPIVDTAHGKHWVFRPKDLVGWWSNRHYDRFGGVESGAPTAWVPGLKPIWLTELGCPAVDAGANQPNMFPDAKSSESGLPHFSSGARDDLVQRRLLEAVIDHFDQPENNPISPVYGGRMVPSTAIQLWTWDARPFPTFPMATDVWSDGAAWATGHWLNGRLGGASVEGLIRAVLADVGFDAVEFRAVPGHLDGFLVDRRMSTRQALEPLLAALCVDAVDTGTSLRFAGRARRADEILVTDDLVEQAKAPLVELRRTQESELPGEISVTFSDAMLDHRRTTVSTRRLVGATRRASSADLAVVAPIPAMIAAADAWLADLWSGRTSAKFALPMNRIALEPGDIVDLTVDGRPMRLMIESLTDGAHRAVEARTLDTEVYRPARSVARARTGTLAAVRPAPVVHVLDIAHVTLDDGIHRPFVAAFASPWPGSLAVWRRDEAASFGHVATVGAPATLGTTASAFTPGPTALWDRAGTLDVTLAGGTLSAAGEASVLDGAGRAAVRAPSGLWEVFQFARAELIGPATWRLSMLLRCQGGSEDAWTGIAAIPAGSPFVLLDDRLTALPVSRDDLGRDLTFRVGPAVEAYTAASYVDIAVTPTGRGLRPWSPTRLVATLDPVSGDLAVSWIRRSRAPGADTWAAVEVPLVETVEAYRLEIRHGVTRLVSIDVATPSWTWPGADRLAALGSGPAELTLAVAELSAELGPGVPREITVRV